MKVRSAKACDPSWIPGTHVVKEDGLPAHFPDSRPAHAKISKWQSKTQAKALKNETMYAIKAYSMGFLLCFGNKMSSLPMKMWLFFFKLLFLLASAGQLGLMWRCYFSLLGEACLEGH